MNTYIPAGASFKSLLHYWQLVLVPQFRQYNYGIEENLKIYNQLAPPDYNLGNCIAPVAIIYSDHDTLASAKDVLHLSNELPNLVIIKRVDDDSFNHLDFVWAMDAKELIYDYIVEWMKLQEEEDERRRQINSDV